ncbi:complement C3 isoform X2 [Fundulus heteroclitus]|uniref:complement C3 isoform X2 n=1 Tax=Fundulus heteroclitus TaxID=8078 RepID=UPI00165AD0C6|nr:complement C3 isoform X2 [Fundulus heteroclitus]
MGRDSVEEPSLWIKRKKLRGFTFTADMESSRRMRWTPFGFVGLLALLSLCSLADGLPLEVLSAPNLLRVETAENIFVEVQDSVQEDAIPVQIKVMDYPTKVKMLAETSVILSKENNFQDFGKIQIKAIDFSKDPNKKQYVYLQAQFPNKLLEKIVLVSFQSGYIFIQTDKGIYNPNSNVMYRIFAVSPGMEPQNDILLDTEIVTPEGITIQSNWRLLRMGVTTEDYRLPEIVSFGVWKVLAKFRTNPHLSFTAEFEVKEYALPSFGVNLTPGSSFFYVDSIDLAVNIKATYNFGEAVDGTAYVLFGVVHEYHKKSFPNSLQTVKILRGEGVAKLTREHITQTFPNILDLVGSSIFVAVSVLTKNGAEMVETELKEIKIVTSPYTIFFKKTSKFFKPGTPLDVVAEVVYPDNSPAQGVTVVVNPGNMEEVTGANGVATFTVNTLESSQTLTILAQTKDPQLTAQGQASASMTAHPYKSKSNSYLPVYVDSAEVELGKTIKVNIFLSRQEREQKDITYLILSRGQMVKHGRYRTTGQGLFSLRLPVTKEMLPSFRIVAYYHPNSEEVVADSVWVDVKESCIGSLSLESVRPAASYENRMGFRLKVTGDPEATVGLVAIDTSVSHLNRKYRLTQRKIWDMVEEYNTACTAGGGKDSMNVFYDAGLLFETSTIPGTPYRTDFKCPTSSRRKRALSLRYNASTPDSSFAQEFQSRVKELQSCCLDGMRNVSDQHSCERRRRHVVGSPACAEAFMHCCKNMKQQAGMKGETQLLHRSKRRAQDTSDGGIPTNSDLISIRTRFPESWLWSEKKMSACPGNKPDCSSTSYETTVMLPDTMTTWQLTGIALSSTHGICVSDPLEVTVRKTFFIDLRLPYSAVHGEPLEIKAVIYNYSPYPINVYLDLMDTNDVCSAAYRSLSYRQEIQVGPQTILPVPFVIMPMKDGHVNVEIKAAVKDSALSDGVRKELRVLPKGKLVKSVKIVTLNPTKDGVNGQQVVMINSEILPSDVVPNTPMKTFIFLTGGEKMTPLQENIISGTTMSGFFQNPVGSAETTMIITTLPVVATMYLDKTDQWETVGLEKRDEALQLIRNGYLRELMHMKKDGSFAAFPNIPSSTWLTAYVVKVFTMISNMVPTEKKHICDAVKFLILATQQSSGMFREVGRMFHVEMMGDVAGTDSDASTTAFCLIAIQEAHATCADTVHSIPQSIDRAAGYLEQRLSTLTNPYAVAMTSYALATENKLNKEILFKFAAPDRSHWPVPKGSLYTLEATGYALLALVKAEAIEEAHPVVRWLSKQPNLTGGFGSTQATIIMYQAIAQYWISVQDIDYGMNVEILIPDRSRPERYRLTKENQHITRTSKVEGINKDIKVMATGTGEAILRMVSLYYTVPKEPESQCETFDMSVQLIPEGEKIYMLRIQVLFKHRDRDASLSILDIDLPAGFTFNKPDLDALSTGRSRLISKYNSTTFLSEKGSLILYLDKISHTRQEEISFRIHQEMKMGILQPAAVKVYEYYNYKPCVKFYSPETVASVSKLCINDHCACAEGECSNQKKGKVNNDERVSKICDSTVGFVYKVRVDNLMDSTSADVYTLQILEVIKEGNIDLGAQGKQRKFLGKKTCKDALDLQTGKTYLIMGSSRDINKDEQNLSYWYVFRSDTWIEYWPLDTECQTHQPACSDLEDTVAQIIMFGCALR